MSITFRAAKREQVGLLLGVAGASGAGKTFSALRLASGLANGQPFALIDTEARRALHYADQFKFDHTDLGPPFSPERYLETIVAAEAAGYPVIVTDSFTHEWSGDGGCCEMQEAEVDRMAGTEDWRKREAVKIAAWIRPKSAHKKLVSRLLQCRAHLIFCLRAEPKIEMTRNKEGKLEIVPKKLLGWSSEWIPVTEKSFMFEMTASFVLSPDRPGVPIPMKLQEQHKPFFPLDQPIGEISGQRLAAWAKGGIPGALTNAGASLDVGAPGPSSRPPGSLQPDLPHDPTPEPWEAVVGDYIAGFDDAPSPAHAEGLRTQWLKVKGDVPPHGQKRVEAAINRARVRLGRGAA